MPAIDLKSGRIYVKLDKTGASWVMIAAGLATDTGMTAIGIGETADGGVEIATTAGADFMIDDLIE